MFSVLKSEIGQKILAAVLFLGSVFAPAWLFIFALAVLIAVDTVIGVLSAKKRYDTAQTPEEKAKHAFRYSRMLRGYMNKAVGYMAFVLGATVVEYAFFKQSPMQMMHDLPVLYFAAIYVLIVELISINESTRFLYGIDFLAFLKSALAIFAKDKAELLEKVEEAAKAAKTGEKS